MGEKIIVGPVNKGLQTNVIPFNIDNDSFPVFINAYQWRGRIKRKRGTGKIGRLQRFFNSTLRSYNPGAFLPFPTFSQFITLDAAGNGNLLTSIPTTSGFPLEVNGNIVPGSVNLIASGGPTVFTDPTMDGFLTPTGTGGPNTINYATGAILIPSQAGNTVTATFNYYPDLPVMGLEDRVSDINQFPETLGFDTRYSYNITTFVPYAIYDVSFYKNPLVDVTLLPGYVPKSMVPPSSITPTSWNGEDYQQFWTVNYQGALWATNGITVPFDPAHIGMQFKTIGTVTVVAGGPPAIVNLQIIAHGLIEGDFLFINEVLTTTGINFQTGYVTFVIDANNVTVEFPNATIAVNGTGGIAQYLTNRSDITKDCLRWYDGNPTDENATNPTLSGNKGWVNFAPPISRDNFSIGNLPADQYYLVGARMIVPFKDRLLFFGPVVQTSGAASQRYLQDTVIYSQNGTPYYTSSFTGDPSLATTLFFPILVPDNQIASAPAYWGDQTGFGGFQTAGIDQPILSVTPNGDILITGFTTVETRLVYTGNDVVPFNFFLISSEYGSGSTFSAIDMGHGVISRGTRAYFITSQNGAERVDLDIPDQVFEISLTSNGSERLCAVRDYINEWIYFTYPSNEQTSKFPTQTLLYNYRDQTWAVFNETYTRYGQFKKRTGYTWSTVGTIYETWNEWNDPWNAGESTLLQPEIIAGNAQGFVVTREDGTGETPSLYIRNITNSGGTTVTSPSHGLEEGDYIIINDALGPVGTQVNGKIFSVFGLTTDTFMLNPSISPLLTTAYSGGGTITRMYIPFIQSKQFPASWGLARKTRLGVQQYLLTMTAVSQITLLIYLSENADNPYNAGAIVPGVSPLNNALIYSTVLFTCPESTNLGLTPANSNLNTPTARDQAQIWHRINTSLIGDTIQVGFTMSDTQMRAVDPILGTPVNAFAEIEIHGFLMDVTSSQLLC